MEKVLSVWIDDMGQRHKPVSQMTTSCRWFEKFKK
jgi:hypothetical protein